MPCWNVTWITVESSYAIATPSDWLKPVPVIKPMGSKAKTNRTFHVRFFPHFEPVTGNCYEFWFSVFMWRHGSQAAMLVNRTIMKKVFWEFDSIVMQNWSDILPLFCTLTWPSHHVSENQELVNLTVCTCCDWSQWLLFQQSFEKLFFMEKTNLNCRVDHPSLLFFKHNLNNNVKDLKNSVSAVECGPLVYGLIYF